MDIIFSRLFWGVFIIVIGLSFVLTALLNIKIPLARILISLIIIFVGVNMLLGAFKNNRTQGYQKDNTYFFQSRDFFPDQSSLSNEYSIVFGGQNINLSDLVLSRDQNLEINTIFGSTTVIVPNNINIRVKASAAFGSVQLPKGNSVVLGDDVYTYQGDPDNSSTLFLEGNAVFGSFKLIVKDQ